MFVSVPTVYEDNNGTIFVTTITRMTPTPNHISVKYHWFSHHIEKDFFIQKIKSEN